jgi:hypothetical protein
MKHARGTERKHVRHTPPSTLPRKQPTSWREITRLAREIAAKAQEIDLLAQGELST